MDKLTLSAKPRDIKSVKINKARKEGLIPAVLYGNKLSNANLFLNKGEFEKIFKKAGESTIINLVTEADKKTHNVLIQEVQHNYLTHDIQHVDFYEVSMTEKLRAKVALEFVGESTAVKNLGGVLVRILNEIEVECLPVDLPHNIEVNISALATLTDSIHIKDLKVPEKVKILSSADEIVVKVQPPRDVEAELSAPVVEDVSKVEGAAEEKPATEETKPETKDKKE